jgi:hypothetical protein
MANAYFGDHPGRLEIPGEMLKSFVPNPHTPVSHETLLFLNLLKNKSVEPLKPPKSARKKKSRCTNKKMLLVLNATQSSTKWV